MGRGTLSAGLILLAMTFYTPANAWAPETRVRMTESAVRLLPASLRLALESHREALLRGALEPMTHEDGPDHRPPWSSGTLDERFVREVDALIQSLANPQSFEQIARHFGAVAHFATDAGFPPGMTDGDGADRYTHFAAFCESRRRKFPWVFYGHDDPDLEQRDYGAWIQSTMRRAMLEDRTLSRIYAEAGVPAEPSAFDDRSVPFAIGSISYSRSVTDIVRVWLAIWAEAGGDQGHTPYKHSEPGGDQRH